MTAQRGQSLVEFSVATTALVLLLLGTIALAGYQEAERRTLLLARQAAFDSLWWNGRSTLAAARDRLTRVMHADALLVAQFDAAAVQSPQPTLQSGTAAPPGHARTAVTAMLGPLQVAGGFLGNQFDLTRHGYHSGRVAVELGPIKGFPEPFASQNLSLTQPFAILGDAWHSASPAQVKSRASGLVPTRSLLDLNLIWRPLQAVLGLIDPPLRQLCLGLIEPDRIPEDRLGPGVTPLPGNCP
jgi:hypothetical protein